MMADRLADPPATAPQEGLTVLVVDDHPVVRHGLLALVSAQAWVARTVEAGTGTDGARLAVLERPQIAIVDLGLPDGSGLQLIGRLRQTVPDCAVVVLTMSSDEWMVQQSLAAGARGYLLKDAPPATLLAALVAVAEGGTVLGPGVGRSTTAGAGGGTGRVPAPLNRLGPRDLTVLRLLAEGRSTADIAHQIRVSEKTVRNRLSSIYSTIGVADRVQAVLLAREKGIDRPGHP